MSSYTTPSGNMHPHTHFWYLEAASAWELCLWQYIHLYVFRGFLLESSWKALLRSWLFPHSHSSLSICKSSYYTQVCPKGLCGLETVSHGLELILPCPPPRSWDYRCVPLHTAYLVLAGLELTILPWLASCPFLQVLRLQRHESAIMG